MKLKVNGIDIPLPFGPRICEMQNGTKLKCDAYLNMVSGSV